ncbi:Transcription initiation factor TFIID subunit 9 [Coniothyrium glycines]
MASPAPDAQPNGISTPPATANATTTSPPTQPPSQHQAAPAASSQPLSAAFPNTSLSDPGTSKRPRDARLIHLILANMGVHAYTERVPLQLLDFAYRYTSSILTDAISYEPPTSTSTGAKKRGGDKEDESGGISINALRTAVGARAASQFSSVLSKDFMSEVASERNRIALPRAEREFGLRLPPERYCFTGVGWGVKEEWEDDEGGSDVDMDGGEEEEEEEGGFGKGGPVLGQGDGVRDTDMGGMGDEEDEDAEAEFEEAMGIKG